MICIQCGISDCWYYVRKILYCNCQKGLLIVHVPIHPPLIFYMKKRRDYTFNLSLIKRKIKNVI